MAKVTQVQNGDQNLIARQAWNEAMQSVETSSDLTGAGTVASPLGISSTITTKLNGIEAGAEVNKLTIAAEETGNFTTPTGSGNTFTNCNNATALQVTITDNACDVGKVLYFNQKGAGAVTYVADAGVTLTDNGVSSLTSTVQGGTDAFLKIAANTYQMI